MISLVDYTKFRRAVSFHGPSTQNANELKDTKTSRTSSFRRRLFRSMRARKPANSLDEASTSSSSCASSSSGDVLQERTISSDTLLNERNAISFTPSADLRSPGSFSSNSSNERKGNNNDDVPRHTVKKKKYFEERNKNIIKKLLHPNYQERNAQYRKLFGNVVDEEDLFLISFSCAYQREILCQGRMYISQRHICFHANILGWETRLAIPVEQVANITKEKAALIFPNSIQIESQKGEKYFFASFVNREKTARALTLVQKAVEADTVVMPEDMWEKMNPERHKHQNGHNRGDIGSAISSPLDNGTVPSSPDFSSITETAQMSRASSLEDLGDAVCPCVDHFGKLLMDTVFPLSVSELYHMIFHDPHWTKKFNQILKNTGYEVSAWAKDKDGIEGRTCTYTMELNHAMAPKNCVVTEKQTIQTVEEHVVVINKETQNSGVPYADHFTVICNYCLTRVGRNQVRLKVHGGLNYKKTIWSMVKGYIEKSTYQGLEHHYTALESTVRAECSARRRDEDAEERDSVSSSIEDPSPEISSRTFASSSDHFRPATATAATVTQPDYSPYIRVVIALLAGLLLVQLLLLLRGTGTPTAVVDMDPLRNDIKELAKRLAAPVAADTRLRETEMLKTLLTTVEQLTADLQQLRREREEL